MENRERAGAGAVGSAGSLGLRVGQAVFSSASLLFMSVGVEFFSYTAFCFLVTIMGLVIPWSCTLAMIDVYSILVGCPLRVPGVMVIVVIGDWVCSGNTLTSSCQFERSGHRSLAPIPWISLHSQILWEVSAVRDDGFLVLVPDGRFLPLQPLVHRLPVTTADC
ncbi:hypothetical protein E2562_014167 [Oryza meyeriana var. granulata]|uniref:CASP-like protein n=1 Tax=Oryza meyeriana var. granulata TaxID=110450 RepID=A0A6G1BKF3_9ORYZ|nr:hypothetical protein E2562_014167 [Oryza meyeriana var. granulata]